jgi:hypothetical protein
VECRIYSCCSGSVVETSPRGQEVISSNPARTMTSTSHLQVVIATSPRAREVRITGLSDTILGLVHTVRLALQVFKLKFLPYRVCTLNTRFCTPYMSNLQNRALIQDLRFRLVRQALSCVPALRNGSLVLRQMLARKRNLTAKHHKC